MIRLGSFAASLNFRILSSDLYTLLKGPPSLAPRFSIAKQLGPTN